jgi:hypothetical protein
MRSLKFLAVILFLCASCVEPYNPEIDQSVFDALVVDGRIDANGEGIVLLTKALPLYKFSDAPVETGAIVSVRSSTGENFNLPEVDPGKYSASNLPVNQTSTYTLYIKRSNGKEYTSDVVKIHPTPAVDNVYFAAAPTGDAVEFRSDSKDTNPDATGYYAFECIETYEYTSQYFSRFKRVNGIPVLRRKGEYVDTCWHELPVPLSLTTTKRLTENTISGHVVTSINIKSPKISRRYSILVKQRSIDEQEYIYRTQLAKTVDQQGNIFAEIPGSVVSNVHNIADAEETVLGYFRGQQTKEKRIFMAHGDLPDNLKVDLDPEICDLESTCPTGVKPTGPNQCVEIGLLSESKIVITSFQFQNATIYVFSPNECGDCTKKGGKTVPPPYWF